MGVADEANLSMKSSVAHQANLVITWWWCAGSPGLADFPFLHSLSSPFLLKEGNSLFDETVPGGFLWSKGGRGKPGSQSLPNSSLASLSFWPICYQRICSQATQMWAGMLSASQKMSRKIIILFDNFVLFWLRFTNSLEKSFHKIIF